MSAPPNPDDTVPNALQEGLVLKNRAKDGGDWKPVIDWFVQNPSLAHEVIADLANERGIQPFIPPSRVSATPTAVGKYELRELLGKGGMGVVYRAFDPSAKREVAVKLLHPGGELSADERARFRFEAEAVAALDHENVVKLYDSDEDNGVPYLVMPLMSGGSLAEWLRGLGPDRCRPPREAARIARDIALGIHHAHQRGLIHRDLKPGNILRDEAGQVRVADFGLARAADLTASRMAGAPLYMAPEQVSSGRRLTTAVDVHAIGVILFELLAGGPPFRGDVGSVLRKVADEPAPAVRTYRPDVPRDLEAILAKCLEKKPEDRYPSALALAEDLENFIHGRPVTATGRGVLTDLARTFGYKAEPQSLFAWRGYFVGTVSSALTLGWIQWAVLADVPQWVSWAGLGCYLGSWALILLTFLVFGRQRLQRADWVNADAHVGMFLGALGLIPVMLWLHAGDVAPLFAPMLMVVGLHTFPGGRTIAGRYYVVGVLMILAAALMPLVPVKFWPGLYGLIVTAVQIGFGLALRRWDRESRAAQAS